MISGLDVKHNVAQGFFNLAPIFLVRVLCRETSFDQSRETADGERRSGAIHHITEKQEALKVKRKCYLKSKTFERSKKSEIF